MKTVDFSESIAASGMKVSRSSHLIEYIKAQDRVHTKIQTGISQKLLCRSEPMFYESFQVQGNENLMT